MSLYSVSPDVAQQNYYNLRVKYFAKLQQKLDAGEITQQYYDDQVQIFSSDLQNPDNLLAQAGDFSIDQFWTDVSNQVQSAKAYVQQGVADATNYTEQKLGSASDYVQEGITNLKNKFNDIASFPKKVYSTVQIVTVVAIVLVAIYFFKKK